jgi:hypothetical protein
MRRVIAMAVIIQSIYNFRQLESHGSQLSGATNRTFLSHPDQILSQGEHEK